MNTLVRVLHLTNLLLKKYFMKKQSVLVILILMLFLLEESLLSQAGRKNIVIDESDKIEYVVQTIAIDKVWAGHPVGFALLTRDKRQYIAYYNSDRRMVVGQRNVSDKNFSLHVLPLTNRETAGGTSTLLGWDSHNYVTLGIDKEGFIHLSGNMHVNPLTYFRSTKPDDISTLVQIMEMVGTNEKRCTYPNFLNTREGELIFHYRDGGSGDGNEIAMPSNRDRAYPEPWPEPASLYLLKVSQK